MLKNLFNINTIKLNEQKILIVLLLPLNIHFKILIKSIKNEKNIKSYSINLHFLIG